MAEIKSHRDLIAWQKAFALGVTVHRITKRFPVEERYGLTSQLRRAAVSVASNIAEGYGRESTSDYIRFLHMARGSVYEVDTQLLFGVEFAYIGQDDQREVEQLVNETSRVLGGLIRSVSASTN